VEFVFIFVVVIKTEEPKEHQNRDITQNGKLE